MIYCYGLTSVVVRRALTPSSHELLSKSLPNLVCSICRVRRQNIINFMITTPRGGNFGVKTVKCMYFFKHLLYSQAKIRHTQYIVLMPKEAFTEIVNFMNPGAGSLLLGRGHISHIVKKCTIFYLNNIQHIDCYCLKGL